jgi:hypothetical protein
MDFNTITNYIIEHYPESCLACNNAGRTSWCDREELEDFFYYEKLNWCGCGDPDIAKTAIKDYLQCVYDWQNDKSADSYINDRKRFKERFGVESVYDDRLLLCLAYELDAARLTDHGSSIGGAWLTEEGKMFLWLLNQNEELQEV